MGWCVEKRSVDPGDTEAEDFLIPFESEMEVYTLKENDESIGQMYLEKGDYNILHYITIDEGHRGRSIDGKSLARFLSEHAVSGLEDDKPIKSTAEAMNGKIQHLRYDNGFEASGFVIDETEHGSPEHSDSLVSTELWNIDEAVEAYIPEEIRDFAEKSLQNQRQVTYGEPEGESTASLNVKTGLGTGSTALSLEIGPGETSLEELIEQIEDMEHPGRYWAHQVEMDSFMPSTHKVAQKLWENGYKPINFSPSVEGQTLSMAQINRPRGPYNMIQEVIELLEATGLDYRIDEEGDMSDAVTILPDNHEPRIDTDEATDEEINEFIEDIENSEFQ